MKDKTFRAIFQIILFLILSACLSNTNLPTSQAVNTIPATATQFSSTSTPIPNCKFNNLDFPPSSQFTPIDGENAIAYSNSESFGGLTLFFPDTKNKTIIHQLESLGISGVDTSFTWSPTGIKIAFLHIRDNEGRMDNKAYLMLADLSEGTICPLLDRPLSYTSPIQLFWSPDEKILTISKSGNIEILNLEEGLITNFAQDIYKDIQWIDSNHIAFIDQTDSETKSDLIIQSLDNLEKKIALSEIPHFLGFSFSPDNKWLVYSYSKPGEFLHETHSNLINLDTGIEIELGKGIFSYWSPNSKYLLGSRGYDGIYLIQLNVSNQVISLDFFGCLYKEPWSKDSINFVISLCRDGSKKAIVGIYNVEEMKLFESDIEISSPVAPAWNSH